MRSFYGIRENLFIDLLLLEYGGPMTLSRPSRSPDSDPNLDIRTSPLFQTLPTFPGVNLCEGFIVTLFQRHSSASQTILLVLGRFQIIITDFLLCSLLNLICSLQSKGHRRNLTISSRPQNDPQPCKDNNPVTIPAPEYSVALK